MKTALEILEDEFSQNDFSNKHATIGQGIKAVIAAGYTEDEAKEAVREFSNKHAAPLDGWVD